ncbi:citrate lyase subunit beta-like protein, mitochondrial [Varroa jacobsoni]|uniref:Citramalyl-CoA lyase, mitochondrial n=1 Tax=Varroa destructor TaxID=109461 RepID=A0A7M7MCX0_VARDE|nr:citrate lyase subunit beta-like protein, mitochondrial [Varroa destructor]XP_022696029.1 citrate lyase subunit beta-like protein, mitochondrial [Varroa jacobsoni]
MFARISRSVARVQRQVRLKSSGPIEPYFKKFVPRRACLYVPGSDISKIEKVQSLDVDALILDCEDGVAATAKETARDTILKALDSFKFGRADVGVRINSVDSGLAEKDFDHIFQAKQLPHSVYLPKVESVEHVTWVVDHVNKRLLKTKEDSCKMLNIVLYIESAIGLIYLKDILQHASELSEISRGVIDAVVFGSDDFTANIGAQRTKDAQEVLMARQQIVLLCRAFKVQPIDMVYIDYKDSEGLRKQALEGVKLGFTGKQVIHPSQVPIVQEAFSPSKEKIEWAKDLIKEFKQHTETGKGVFNFRGSMIDMPTILQAKNILEFDYVIRGEELPKKYRVDPNNDDVVKE